MKPTRAFLGHVSRTLRERLYLVLLALLLGSLLVWSRSVEHDRIEQQEADRLSVQARAVEQNLVRPLSAVYAALRDARSDLAGWPRARQSARMTERLDLLSRLPLGVRDWVWQDAEGRALAGGRHERIGAERSDRESFDGPMAHPEVQTLYVSPPLRTSEGAYAVTLSMAVLSPSGAFEGLLAATLDADYFNPLFESALYAPDMRTALIHGDGAVIVQNRGHVPIPDGLNVGLPGTPFSRHLEGGTLASVHTGQALLATGDTRLMALRTVQPPALHMNKPLVLMVSRNRDALFAHWAVENQALAAGCTLLFGLSWAALVAAQRRRGQAERLALAHRARLASEAQRLASALRGADLALWDLDLKTGLAAANDRWSTMLGLEPGEVRADIAGWQSLVHPDDRERAMAAQEDHIAGRTPLFETTYRMRHRDGHWVWVLDRGRVVERDAAGRALRMVGTHMDISDRMLALETLRRSEEGLAITLQSIGDGVIATDSFGLITRINEAARKLTGWPGDEALGQPLRSVFGIGQAGARRADTDPVVDVLHRGQAVGQSTGAVLVSRDGTERRVAHTAAPIRSVTGQVVGVVLVFSDVTENHCMVQALRDREVQLHTMADALPGPLARLDRDGRYVFANAAYERWFGLKPADMLGRRREEVLVPEALEHVKPLIERALAGVSANTDATVQTLAGQRHAVVTALPDRDADGHVAGVILTTVDFTDRKLAEQELRASEASRRMAGRLARLGGWRYEVATRQLWLPPEIEGLLPESRKGPLDADVALQRVLPAHREALRARIRACVAQGETFDFEMALRAGDGREIQVRMIGEAERGEGGRVVLLQGAIQDVTESRREQQQLRLLQASVARLNDVVVITEAEPMNEGGPPIVFVNDAFERVTGWPREAVLGRSVRLLQGPLTDAAEVARIDLAQREREPVRAELQYCTRDGRPYWAQVEIVPLLDAAGMATHLVTVQRDITERKEGERERLELERHLREAQKMESIGTLAGGIAHDFNNILAAILGNVALAQGDLPAGHAASLSLEQIRRAGLRARSLVQQILAFSRHQPQVLHVQPLRPAVEETISLLRATLPAGVRLHSCLADEPLRVQADATQLQQLLMNLCTNAWHALPDGHGRIEVGLRAVSRAAAAHASLGAGPPGPCAHLWVRDDGVGMDAATRQRIFDPFFTTKPVGKGTGLGLSVVHGIVRGHGGAMAVESAPGQGSTFHLVLPLAQAEGLAAVLGAGAKPAFGAGPVAGVNVLYVDDDEVMTLMVQRLLQRAGYRVTVCNEAAEALALVRADPTRFDVAVSDYNMPEMTGTELAGALARVQPGLPVIISSGFITDALREQALESHVAAVLQKEHTLDELPALVGSVLIGQP